MKVSKTNYVPGEKSNPILINADDFGLDHETNLAVVGLLKSDRIQRATLLVNMPSTKEAVDLAKANDLLPKLGLHINLTDGAPLSNDIKETRFCQFGVYAVREVERGTRLHITWREKKAVEKEVWAQFEKFKELTGQYPKHVDSHRHVHNYLPFLFICMKIAKKCHVESMRIGINLYDRKEASFAKKAYKFVLNTIIKRRFKHTDYMGAYLEYVDYFDAPTDKTCEIMVHPTYYKGKIVDTIYDEKEDKTYYDFDRIR